MEQNQIEELKARLAQLKGEPEEEQPIEEPASAVDPALVERRGRFTGAQQRLANTLALGGRTNMIDSGRTEANVLSDKLVTMQIVRLMLDNDGSDGVLCATVGWNSQSSQTLAQRMNNHPSATECEPRWRLKMQPIDAQRSYYKKQANLLKLPAVEPPVPETPLHKIAFERLTAEEFAAFVVDFHRKVVGWDLKNFVFDNLDTPAAEFFAGFVAIQHEADSEEESLYQGAFAAHLRATALVSEEECQDFLDFIRWMNSMDIRETERRAARIARQTLRSARPNANIAAQPAKS